jgi:hypothetical protein
MIGNVSGSSGNTPINPIKKSNDAGHAKVDGKKGVSSSSSDVVEISKEAKDIEKVVANLKGKLDKIPDVRPEKVESATYKAKKGFYNTHEVAKKTAEILLKKNII